MPKQDRPKAKRALVATVAVGVVLGLALGGWLLARSRSDNNAQGSATPQLYRLPTNPQERYSITLDGPVYNIADVVGSPDSLVVRVLVDGGEEIRIFDGNGSERWRREFEDITSIELVEQSDSAGESADQDVLVVVDPSRDEPGQLILLDGASGTERWSNDMDELQFVSAANGKLAVFNQGDPDPARDFDLTDALHVEVFDMATGDKSADRRFDRIVDWSTWQAGRFIVEKDGEYLVIDEQLEAVSEGIPATGGAVAMMGDQVVVAGDGTLTRYGLDGKEKVTADLGLGRLYYLGGVEGSSWLFWTAEDECGIVDLSGKQPTLQWKITNCLVEPRYPVVRFDDGEPYAVLYERKIGGVLVNARTGKREFTNEGENLLVFANGVLGGDRRMDVTAYAIPGVEKTYSVELEGQTVYEPLDDGYAIADSRFAPENRGEFGLTVYASR